MDRQGWEEIHDAVSLSMEKCQSIQERARRRLEESDGSSQGFPVRVHLISFEPASRQREPGSDG